MCVSNVSRIVNLETDEHVLGQVKIGNISGLMVLSWCLLAMVRPSSLPNLALCAV